MGNNDAREQLEVCKQEYLKLEAVIEQVGLMWDSATSQGFPFLYNSESVPQLRALLGDEGEALRQHDQQLLAPIQDWKDRHAEHGGSAPLSELQEILDEA